MEAADPRPAEGTHWEAPEPQPGVEDRLRREGFPRSTPVTGAVLEARAASAALRRRAYGVPEHRARRWALLLLADRVEVAEDRLGSAIGGILERLGLHAGARGARENPFLFVGAAAAGFWIAKRILR